MGNLLNRYICGVLLLGFSLGAGLCGIVALQSAKGVMETPTLGSILNGEWTKAFESKFAEKTVMYDSARRLMGDLDYALFHEGRKGVVIGRDGWLFSSEEFQTSRHDRKNYGNHLRYVEEIDRALLESNTKLIIALIPSKARLQKEVLKGAGMPPEREVYFSRFMQDLKNRGIEFVSLSPVLGGEGYLKTDTHWSQSGSEASARIIAREIKPHCIHCNDVYRNVKGDRYEYDGDLLQYVPISDIAVLRSDKLHRYSLETEGGAADLFGDQKPDIVLVGTSYSKRRDFNFENFLKEHTGSDVLNAAQEGKGPFIAMKDYLAAKTYQPKIIVWEIPERYLTIGE